MFRLFMIAPRSNEPQRSNPPLQSLSRIADGVLRSFMAERAFHRSFAVGPEGNFLNLGFPLGHLEIHFNCPVLTFLG